MNLRSGGERKKSRKQLEAEESERLLQDVSDAEQLDPADVVAELERE